MRCFNPSSLLCLLVRTNGISVKSHHRLPARPPCDYPLPTISAAALESFRRPTGEGQFRQMARCEPSVANLRRYLEKVWPCWLWTGCALASWKCEVTILQPPLPLPHHDLTNSVEQSQQTHTGTSFFINIPDLDQGERDRGEKSYTLKVII